MSALLDTLAGTDSRFAWCGLLEPTAPVVMPIAEPMVLTWNDQASLVFAGGVLKASGVAKLAWLIEQESRRPATRIVYVALACQGGRLGGLRTAAAAIAEARRHAAVVAFLECVAFGPALWLAYQCDLVFASPTTALGWLECFSDAGDFDCDASLGMVLDLASLSPCVPAATFGRLFQSSVNGEQAEAMGLVGGLRSDVWALSGLDPNSWGPRQ